MKFLCNINVPPLHKHTLSQCFFLFLKFFWTVKRHPVFACSWTQVLSTIDLSQLIDFYTMQLLCYCHVIVQSCFCSDPKINSPDFVWRVYKTSYPVLTHRKLGTTTTEMHTQKTCLRLQHRYTHIQSFPSLLGTFHYIAFCPHKVGQFPQCDCVNWFMTHNINNNCQHTHTQVMMKLVISNQMPFT